MGSDFSFDVKISSHLIKSSILYSGDCCVTADNEAQL